MYSVINYLGLVGIFLSACLLMPSLTGFFAGETELAVSLLIYAILGGFLSISVRFASSHEDDGLDRNAALSLAIIGWVFFPFALAFPIAGIFDIAYGPALFEAISAITTTAADGVGGTDGLTRSAIMLRAALQWAGGLATILTFIILLGPIGVGGMPKTRRSIGEGAGRAVSGIQRMAGSITRYYSAATAFCFVLLMLTGLAPFEAFVLSLTALSAGGYLPSSAQLFELGNAFTLVIMAVFFLLASTSVYWHRMIARLQWEALFRHRESYMMIIVMLAVTFAFMIAFTATPGMLEATGTPQLMAEAFFNAASLVSTSGLESNAGTFTLLTPAFIFALLLVGGCSYSSAGGIKYYRVGAMVFHARYDLSKLVYPSIVVPYRFGTEPYDLDVMKAIWTMFAASLTVIAICAGLLAAQGLDFQASLTAALASFANAGPAYSEAWAPRGAEGWLGYAEMPLGMKFTLAATMMIGHLEVIAFLAFLAPRRLFV